MISFIIPTKNEEKALEATLKNIKELSARHEIIVSDGGSTDGTLAIVERYADKVLKYEGLKRQTIGQGRNAGAAVAVGQYLVFVDADVSIPDINNFFSHAVGIFEREPRLLALAPCLRVLSGHGTGTDIFIFLMLTLYNRFLNNIIHVGGAPGEFQMVRSSAFRDIGGYSEKLVAGEDYDFFERLARKGRTMLAPGLSVYHTSRRAKKVGWPALLATWFGNFIFIKFLGRSMSTEWKEVR